jgi:hypothetical protein
LDITFVVTGRINNNRNNPIIRVGLDPFQGLQSRHSRHVEVEQNDIGVGILCITGRVLEILDQFQTIGGESKIRLYTGHCEGVFDEELVFKIIVTDENYRDTMHEATPGFRDEHSNLI